MSDERVLRNLGVISKLKQGDKLLTEGEYFSIYNPTALRSLMRMLYRENRETNLIRIQNLIRDAKTQTTAMVSEFATSETEATFAPRLKHEIEHKGQVNRCARVLEALGESVHGVDNLILTYTDDASIVSSFQALKADIVDFLNNMQSVAKTSPVMERLTDGATAD